MFVGWLSSTFATDLHILYYIMQNSAELDFFFEYGDFSQYKILEVIGKSSYCVVCSTIDLTILKPEVAVVIGLYAYFAA